MNDRHPFAPASAVSVALATFNGERYLREQLDSLERQTIKPAELVVCDDRSTDDTATVVRHFADVASFPVVLHVNDERLGWRGNFVKASGLCTHDLIAFCDQDDLWYPDKISTMVATFADPSIVLAYHNADLVDAEGKPYDTLLPVDTQRRLIPALSRPTPWSNPLGLTIVFRSFLARYNDLWPSSVDLAVPTHPAAHDQWFYFLATNIGTIAALPERLLGYRQHGGNSVGWSTPSTHRKATRDVDHLLAETERILAMLRPFCSVLAAAARRGGPWSPAFEAAAAKNERLRERMELRRSLLRADRLPTRLRCVARQIAHGGYGQGADWGLGKSALLEDLTVGLFGSGPRGVGTPAT